MYFLDNWHKFALVIALVFGYSLWTTLYLGQTQVAKTERSLDQLRERHAVAAKEEMMQQTVLTNNLYAAGWGVIGVVSFLVFVGDLRRLLRPAVTAGLLLLLAAGSGCGWKPFQPVKLEVIKSTEEAFLLPLTGDGKKQSSSTNEEYLKENMVYTQQVQIPQQWVPKGFETMGYNGEWRDAALLIKVDKSPVTREWTADPNSGTSKKNEAIWVMTSDQVEFSTGWTITARIDNRDDAVKFLHNYPNGSLEKVMDGEVRSKLQAEFGLAVTDLPMDTLRKAATPVIVKVMKNVTEFFKSRGILITNLGISGGFVYKDKSIIETMVRVFNAEQEKSVAMAETNAQLERNKKVILDATGKADAIMKTKKAEADGIKMVADARGYEIDKAKTDMASYMQLKQLELQRELLLKWDGAYPRYFLGGGGGGPGMLLQLPPIETVPKKDDKK